MLTAQAGRQAKGVVNPHQGGEPWAPGCRMKMSLSSGMVFNASVRVRVSVGVSFGMSVGCMWR